MPGIFYPMLTQLKRLTRALRALPRRGGAWPGWDVPGEPRAPSPGAAGASAATVEARPSVFGRSRIYADSARQGVEAVLRNTPDDPQRRAILGLALAYMGRKADAIREGERAVSLTPATRDGFVGPYFRHLPARIYTLVGEPEKAMDQIEPLLRMPYVLSPGWLKIDPAFDPLRSNPRFKELTEPS